MRDPVVVSVLAARLLVRVVGLVADPDAGRAPGTGRARLLV